MAKIEQDSFEHSMRHQLNFRKVSMTGKSRKEKKGLIAQTLEIQFGFNRKQDNFAKTKQLGLF